MINRPRRNATSRRRSSSSEAFGSAARLIRALARTARTPQSLRHTPLQLLPARTHADARVYPYVEGRSVTIPSVTCLDGGRKRQRAVTRILIADDHEVVRSGLRSILDGQPNCEVIAEASDGKEAILKALETKPDIAVLDYALPFVNGLEVTRQIRARLPRTEILIFTMHDNEALIQDLLRAGARGFVLKTEAKRDLLAAIEALASHTPYFTAKTSETLLESFLEKPERRQSVLTNRERGVVQLIAEGYSNKEIAEFLTISIKTVKTHRASIMRKLGLTSRAALVRYAIRNKFVEP